MIPPLTWIEQMLVFPRHIVRPVHWAGQGIAGLSRWYLDTEQGAVEAWFLPSDATSAVRKPAVIFAHGNAELIEHWPVLLVAYQHLGMHVLLPEYRGYGRSAGVPSESAITQDFVRFYDRLAARSDVDPERIVFHGRSLGGGVVLALARERNPAAVILQSTFTSIAAVAKKYGVPRFLIRNNFDNLTRIRSVQAPVFIAHGRRDGLTPFSHGEALRKAAKKARFVEYDADHNDCPPDWPPFFEEIERFLRDAGVLSAEPTTTSEQVTG